MKRLAGRFLLLVWTSLLVSRAVADDTIDGIVATKNFDQVETSPDKLWAAVTRTYPIPERGAIWRDTGSSTCLLVRQVEDSNLEPEFVQWENPALVILKVGWSPDSRFLIVVCTTPGGHQPWAFPTLVLDVKDYSLRTVSPLGSIVAKDFKFTGPDTVQLKTGEPSSPTSVDFNLATHISELPVLTQLKAEQH